MLKNCSESLTLRILCSLIYEAEEVKDIHKIMEDTSCEEEKTIKRRNGGALM